MSGGSFYRIVKILFKSSLAYYLVAFLIAWVATQTAF